MTPSLSSPALRAGTPARRRRGLAAMVLVGLALAAIPALADDNRYDLQRQQTTPSELARPPRSDLAGRATAITPDQEKAIREAIAAANIEPSPDPGVDLQDGAVVPRNFPVRPAPRQIGEIVPEYRGYGVAVVGDRILIVDTKTETIVKAL